MGRGRGGGWGAGGEGPRAQGRAVQVEPMKPILKPPGTKRLKLKYDKLLSILLQVAFNFKLRHYTKVWEAADLVEERGEYERVRLATVRLRRLTP